MPIHPLERHRYVEPIHSEGKDNYIDQLYNIISSKEDYINPTADGKLSWWSVNLCTYDSSVAMENWQYRLPEVSM